MTTMLKLRGSDYADYLFDTENNSVWSISLKRYLKWSNAAVPTVTLTRRSSIPGVTFRPWREKFSLDGIRSISGIWGGVPEQSPQH